MTSPRVVVEVSSTVRRVALRPERVRRLVTSTLDSEGIRDAMVSVAFVGRDAITRLNRDYLGHDAATDVISFGMGRDAPGLPAVGDIYVCPEVAARNARRLGIPPTQELARLVIHGALHVAGHDHPDDDTRVNSEMWRRQERLLAHRD